MCSANIGKDKLQHDFVLQGSSFPVNLSRRQKDSDVPVSPFSLLLVLFYIECNIRHDICGDELTARAA